MSLFTEPSKAFILLIMVAMATYVWQFANVVDYVAGKMEDSSLAAIQDAVRLGDNFSFIPMANVIPVEKTVEMCPNKCVIKECTIHFRRSAHDSNSSECYISVGDKQIDCRQPKGAEILVIHLGYQCQIRASLTFGLNAQLFDGLRNVQLHEYANEIPRGDVLAALISPEWMSQQQPNFAKHFEFLNMNKLNKKQRMPKKNAAVAFIWKRGFRLQSGQLHVSDNKVTLKQNYTVGMEFTPSQEDISWSNLTKKYPKSEHGYHSAENCRPRAKVAVIIPYRDRDMHLRMFLNNIIPFLEMQGFNFTIYVVEQEQPVIFNRAMLLNVGFAEAERIAGTHDAYIFHDVDKIPTDLCNVYACARQPRHLVVAWDTFGYSLVYNTFVGGALCLTHDQMKKINGFSNVFFGWGGEDDEMYARLQQKHYNISRYPSEVGRYASFSHKRDTGNPGSQRGMKESLDHAKIMDKEGLTTLKYNLTRHDRKQLYHHLYVHVDGPLSQKDMVQKYSIRKGVPKAPRVPPMKPPVKAPVRAPVKAPVRAPVKAPVRAPVKAPVRASVRAPVNAPVGGVRRNDRNVVKA